MGTETKLTAKQASVKIVKLLKGIDNSATQISKHQSVIGEAIPELQKLFGGLANPAQPAKPNGQKQPLAKAAPKEKSKAKAPAKATSKPKAQTPAKAQPKAKPQAPAKAQPKTESGKAKAKVKPPVAGRPALKQAVQNVMSSNSGSMTAADIWKATTSQYGYWSRQSLYNVLKKDPKTFVRDNDKFSLSGKIKSDAKADELVAAVAADSDTSKVA